MKTITVRFDRQSGQAVKPVHGICNGPLSESGLIDTSAFYEEIGIPFIRLHDTDTPTSRTLVDISRIFPNFDADESDPANYFFEHTDQLLLAIDRLGAKPIYRLGESIDHSIFKRYARPPKDFEKWTRICVNIIRHYNEGWAGGFTLGISYWEIWNEPDLGPKMWTGTLEAFNDFYATAARELKKRFPHLKFGGPGHCAFGEEKVKAFAENCAKHGAPLDFYSFHYYSPSDTELLQMALDARRWLDESGFPDTEIHLNEWHYNPYGGALWGMGPVEQNEAIRFMRGLESAAFLNTVLIGWQDTPIDRAFYYTVTTTRWGLYDDRTPNKTYYGMQAFGELTRYGERVAAAGNLPEGSRTLAGRNAAGDLAILTACWKSGPLEIAFDIDGIERFGSIEVRMLDPTHDLEKVFSAGTVSGPLKVRTVSESSVILIEMKKSRPDPAEK